MSSDKVVNFPLGRKNEEAPESMAPVQNVVDAIESLLEQAKQGRVRAIAYAFGKPSYTTSYGWIGVGDDIVMNAVLHSGVGILNTAMAMEMDDAATLVVDTGDGPEKA